MEWRFLAIRNESAFQEMKLAADHRRDMPFVI
jgi:hypothetical protein